MKSKVLKVPHNCYLILTANCNMRCLHCYGSYGVDVPKKELSGEEWSSILKDLSNAGIFFVNISGGEPTMHKDFVKILESLKENEMYFMLTTNGVFSDKIRNEILKVKDYILGIQISLDGPDWETHGFLRKDIMGNSRKEFFDRALNSIKIFIQNGIRVSIATCLHTSNIEKMDKMKDLIIKLKPSNWSISTISISGRAKKRENLYVSEAFYPNEFWKQLKLCCEKKGIDVTFVDMPNVLKENNDSKIYYECPAAKWFCEIYSDGITTPCPLSRVNVIDKNLKWDNICNSNIKKIWNGLPFNVFRKFQNLGCDGCNAKSKCDRCPPQSVQWFNDPLLPPPYCIENGKKLELCHLKELKDKLEEAKKVNNREEYGIKE